MPVDLRRRGGQSAAKLPAGGAAHLRYHSGAVLDLWEVEIPEETAKTPTGVFVRYTFADGTVYQYDTDQIQMNEVRLALGLH